MRRGGNRPKEKGAQTFGREEDGEPRWSELECGRGISTRRRYKKILREALRDLEGAEAERIRSLSKVYWVVSVYRAGR